MKNAETDVRIITVTYRFKHRREPRGRRLWYFTFGGYSGHWPAPAVMTYTKAREAAIEEARARGTRFITVLP